ncbi:organic cation transporter protein-like [Gigantopelta aegis]|uniref:organic cation transporter protein-like n=1 Tax=Gigantopelta aegis TaxID=1735272 RepID=UPI001B88917F|nr:organic cation transporter protein-like [Gigantopelta aegis]XP_041370475.1 organic cation transporter protein-like [Gigantopelta aegis]
MVIDDILENLGGCGRFQTLVYLVLSLIYMRGAWHVFAIVYLGDAGEHFCLSPLDHQANQSVDGNSTELWVKEQCEVVHYLMNGSSNITMATPCSSWSFKSKFETTIVTDWDLVCDRNYVVELSMTIYMVGTAVGALTLTAMADRFGRKRILLPCLILQTVVGTGVAFVNNVVLFTTLRFFVGFLNMGISLTTYVLITELFPASHRTQPSIAIQCFWAVGVMSLALFGYCVRNWRHLQLLISLPNILAVVALWFVPESLHWLLATNRTVKAVTVLKMVARVNKLSRFHEDELTEENLSSVQQLLRDQGNCVDYGMKQFTLNPDLNTTEDFKLMNTTEQTDLFELNGIARQNEDFRSEKTNLQTVPVEFNHCNSHGSRQKEEDLRSEEASRQKVPEELSCHLDETHQRGEDVSMETRTSSVSSQGEGETVHHFLRSEKSSDENDCIQEYNGLNNEDEDGCHLVCNKSKSVFSQLKNKSDEPTVSLGSGDDVCEEKRTKTCRDSTSGTGMEKSACGLFRSPRMRLYTIVVFYLFLVNSLSYFGISLSTPILHGNPFLNLFFMGLVELPAHVICVFTILWSGRRRLMCVFLLICAVTSGAAVFVPEYTESGVSLQSLKIGLVMLGKFGITGSYSTVYLFSAELFPTVVRNQAMGMASFFENLGSISAPFIVYAAKTLPRLPLLLFSGLTFVGSVVVLLLPETHRKPLPETFDEVESWPSRNSKPDDNRTS